MWSEPAGGGSAWRTAPEAHAPAATGQPYQQSLFEGTAVPYLMFGFCVRRQPPAWAASQLQLHTGRALVGAGAVTSGTYVQRWSVQGVQAFQDKHVDEEQVSQGGSSSEFEGPAALGRVLQTGPGGPEAGWKLR